MRKLIAIFCVVVGVICLVGAGGIVFYNNRQTKEAGQFSEKILQQVKTEIEENSHKTPEKIPTVSVLGYDSVGVLSIPALQLELPVLDEWNYEKLKKAPCVYYGNCFERDFVIAGHNYNTHFGRLSQLKAGDIVDFTDAGGKTHRYEVVLTETLAKTATNEMLTSGFDLSLYTCTRGALNRTTIRCTKK